ncbi:MAG: peptidase M4 family protein [Acidobacteria bacterium]|nr:peptidase M4 family protein [Acidobacteriota bacterium]
MRRYIYLTLFFFGLFVAIFALNTGTQANLKKFNKGTQQELNLAKSMSYEYLANYASSHGIDSAKDLKVSNVFIDDLSMAHTKMQQTVNGVPVFGGETIVHLNSDGSLFNITDSLVSKVSVNTQPTLTNTEALNKATELYGCSDCLTAEPKIDMFVLRRKGKDHLVYRVQLERIDGSHDTAMPVYFIDAHSGQKIWEYNNLQTAGVTGTGTSTYYGNLSFNAYQSGATFYMEDVTRKIGVFDYKNTTTSLSRSTDTDNVWNATNQRAIVDAQYGVAATYDYFKTVHGRNGIDGNGGPGSTTSIDGVTSLIGARVHYSTRYNNAFWNGQYMTFGDGDGSTFSSLTTVDICGHELTHGVTERTANLVYSGESGALNESMSDVFGVMVDRFLRGESANTYKIGEECFTPANGTGDALRYMDNPHLAGNGGFTSDDDPDHYSERYTGTADNGGVHINSGIANKAFYLVAKGGSHHLGGTMTGIGPGDAEKIWFRALTSFMTSSTNFAGARTATLNAATALFGNGSTQYNAVCQAWSMVGVGTSCTAPPPPPPPTGAELLVNGGFETSLSPWVASGAGALYTNNGNFPQAGTGYAYFGAANSVSGQTYQQFTIPAGTSKTLSFFLNVTSAETTTSTQFDKLFVEVRNSSGALLATLATYSNLNKGTSGSYGTAKSFSLAAYAGQTIRVQFRTTTDSSAITTFRVDSASVK